MLKDLIHFETGYVLAALSSKYVFQFVKDSNLSESWLRENFLLELNKIIFLELRRLFPKLPDHHYNSLIDNFTVQIYRDNEIKDYDKRYNSTNIANFLHKIFTYLVENFLVNIHNSIYIKANRFLEWQHVMTSLMPIHVISYFFYKSKYDVNTLISLLKDKFSFVLFPYHQNLIDLLKDGFIDLHVHLNGILEADHIVCFLIEDPYSFYNEIKNIRFDDHMIRHFFQQFDIEFTPSVLFKLLLLAKALRALLIKLLTELQYQEKENRSSISYMDLSLLLDIDFLNYESLMKYLYSLNYSIHPYEEVLSMKSDLNGYEKLTKNNSYITHFELLFLYDLFNSLFQLNFYESIVFYVYLLISNLIKRFVILQIDQYGLEQFYKLFRAGLREIPEKNFELKFLQLNTFYKPSLTYLEGRLTPERKTRKLINKVMRIIKTYKKLRRGSSIRYDLGLVLHFIKEKDESSSTFIRHSKLRQEIMKRASAIVQCLKLDPRIREYICGIDAASNELFAPPEVFAPAFRYIKESIKNYQLSDKGLSDTKLVQLPNIRITFHVGEDFNHLLSGLRAIYEAITFLPLEPGDRLGHAVALGIAPEQWLRKVPDTLYLKKGEWLDNLIFTFIILYENYENVSVEDNCLCDFPTKDFSYILEKEIFRFFLEIYGEDLKDKISIFDIIESYYCRSIDPQLLFYSKEDLSIEYKNQIVKANGSKPTDIQLKLYRFYHDGVYRKQYDEYIKINRYDKIFNVELIKFIQNKLKKMISERQIGLEVMISSNVRISYYDDFKDHHILKWLSDKYLNSNIILCSDDPGVFHTNIQNEYLILAQILLNRDDMNHTRSCLQKLKEQAKRWSFKDRIKRRS